MDVSTGLIGANSISAGQKSIKEADPPVRRGGSNGDLPAAANQSSLSKAISQGIGPEDKITADAMKGGESAPRMSGIDIVAVSQSVSKEVQNRLGSVGGDSASTRGYAFGQYEQAQVAGGNPLAQALGSVLKAMEQGAASVGGESREAVGRGEPGLSGDPEKMLGLLRRAQSELLIADNPVGGLLDTKI